MLKVLIKKQLGEVFRSYFYNAKKGEMRSRGAVAGWFVFFFVVMVGILGGMFTFLSLSLCGGMTAAGMGWLYFDILSGIAIVLGAFGSVFNTYSSLYLPKDNDLLLSMPIPVRVIITARLVSVYLMGAMYVAVVFLPALIVYWIVAGATVSNVVCGILLFLLLTVIVLMLSCLLGWVVAKLSLRLKNRSFLVVFLALAFIGGYYFVYFQAQAVIRDLLLHAQEYGENIKGSAYGLYLFGRVGEGDWLDTALFLGITALAAWGIYLLLSRSFLKLATSGASVVKTRYVEKRAREKSAFGALLGKELARFTASPNYMLNCGLGIVLLPAVGVLLLVGGSRVLAAVGEMFPGMPGCVEVLLCALLCTASVMNDMAAPSVSLEGKSLWLVQSMPVQAKTVLRAKTALQLLLTAAPMAVAYGLIMAAVDSSLPLRGMMLVFLLAHTALSAELDTFIGTRMAMLNWSSEIVVIKQSGGVAAALFGGWGIGIVPGVLYLLAGYRLGPVAYLGIVAAVFAGVALWLQHWLDTKGSRMFTELS